MNNIQWKIVTTEEEFLKETQGWTGPIACDVETAKDVHLLGISFSNKEKSFYVPITTYTSQAFETVIKENLFKLLKQFIPVQRLVGHNFTYDKRFIDKHFGIASNWVFDTRIGWHLASAPSGPRPYGLKDAQVEVLGWETKGDTKLKAEVEAAGGRLSNGDHYLASLETLAKYACLDTLATYQLYSALKPFFDQHDYHWMMAKMMEYNLLLERNTQEGILVDVPGLEKAHKRLTNARDAGKRRLDKQLAEVIQELETDWLEQRLTKYKRETARELFLQQDHKWKKFNWNSDSDKRELFYDKLNNEVIYTTDSGKPSTNADSVKQMQGEWVESYLKYETSNTLVSNFTGPYLDSVRNNRIHPGFNICGTVSYRLSGFKPYLLNAPYDQKLMMKNFICDPGWVGVHADLSAIEPTITAHYSEDPSLLKVFRDGLGDIYLDLALVMFPHDMELRAGYDPLVPISEEVKKRFSKQRKIAKIIHLAVSYTGTKITVHRNLMKEGFELSIWDADRLVQAYWRAFRKVDMFSKRLRELNRKEGLLRNIIGRIIRVPDPDYKDLFNRFIQSSGHDVLVLWVLEIDRLSKEWGIEMRPVVVDIHDSTSWQVEKENKEAGKQIFEKALANVNELLGLSVPIRMECKYFTTLAGLKGDD